MGPLNYPGYLTIYRDSVRMVLFSGARGDTGVAHPREGVQRYALPRIINRKREILSLHSLIFHYQDIQLAFIKAVKLLNSTGSEYTVGSL